MLVSSQNCACFGRYSTYGTDDKVHASVDVGERELALLHLPNGGDWLQRLLRREGRFIFLFLFGAESTVDLGMGDLVRPEVPLNGPWW